MTEFAWRRDMIDVTSMWRTDTSWVFIDAAGHKHQYYTDGKPADHYDPSAQYELPTIVWVSEGPGYYPDGSEYDTGHYECCQCGEEVKPQCTGDSFRQHIPGMTHYEIDGEPVTREEFERRYEEEYPQ